MPALLEIALVAVAASLLFGVVWAVIGARLGGGPEERERTLMEDPRSGAGTPGTPQQVPPPARKDPPAA